MALRCTVRCPHCNSLIDYRSVGQKYLGSPFRVCKYCGNKYIDNKFVEVALLTKKDFILSFPWLKSIMYICISMFMIIPSLIFTFSDGFDIAFLFISAFGSIFLISPIKELITLIRYITLKDDDFLKEIEKSKIRLSDPEYVIALDKIGARVTDDLLTWAINAINNPNKHVESPISKKEVTNVEIRYCRMCGADIINGSRFCRKCGTEIMEENNNDL